MAASFCPIEVHFANSESSGSPTPSSGNARQTGSGSQWGNAASIPLNPPKAFDRTASRQRPEIGQCEPTSMGRTGRQRFLKWKWSA
jgi:hypothetical protein